MDEVPNVLPSELPQPPQEAEKLTTAQEVLDKARSMMTPKVLTDPSVLKSPLHIQPLKHTQSMLLFYLYNCMTKTLATLYCVLPFYYTVASSLYIVYFHFITLLQELASKHFTAYIILAVNSVRAE